MAKVITTEVEVECFAMHCEEVADGSCTNVDGAFLTAADALQEVFREIGPERDRFTDWRRCTEEPWATLARALG